jgi:hypothetical protein
MKGLKLGIAAAVIAVGFSACDTQDQERERHLVMVTTYVDSIHGLTPVYTHTYWDTLDKGYQERIAVLEAEREQLREEDRARLDASIARYNELKKAYEDTIRAREMSAANAAAASPNYKTVLRNALFGEGMIGDDMDFAFVNGNNLLDVYRRFVNTVDKNKDNYTREDWDEIKVLYEALDTRKNTVEKDAPNGDNTKIGCVPLPTVNW